MTLKTDIQAMTGAHAGITVSQFANELELSILLTCLSMQKVVLII